MTLVVPCLDNIYIYGFADLCNRNNWCNKTYFFGFWFPEGGRGGCACMGMVCYHFIVHILISNSDLCRAMLPNYLRTYSSALCRLGPFRRHLRSKTMAKVYPKSWFWMHAFDCQARTNTQNLHAILYVFCLEQWLAIVQSCAGKPTWWHIPELFARFEPWRRHLRRVKSAKGSWKSEF